jgi:Tol biopolymer transport system component
LATAQPAPAPRLSSVRPLTSGFKSDHFIVPCFAPTGGKFTFNGRCSTDKRDALYLFRLDSTRLERIYEGDSPVCYPAWSPDGTAICFNAGSSLYEYNVNTGRTRRVLTDAVKWGATPAYTRDSRKILYRSPYGLRAYNRSSKLSARLTSRPGDRQPAPNPNGREIALMGLADDGTVKLYLIQTDGTKRKQITPHKGSFSHPSWSPDGELLLYDRTIDQRCNLCVVDRRTGIETRLTNEDSAAAQFGCFSPDGRTIVFVRQDKTGQNLLIGGFELGVLPMAKDTPVTPKRDTAARVVLPDTSSPADSTLQSAADTFDRSRYKIVVFSDDDAQAEEFLSRLRRIGYLNPDSYVASSPNATATIKHNQAPDVVIEEISDLVETYLNLRLEPLSDPQVPETNIYINLP